ncbi:MAG TPA: hypothetical protein VMJ12_04585, partial [Candidatus Acidoferrales bacterium]|nr:hypothetical protein [Candidatus Acidoferrales bacterium]
MQTTPNGGPARRTPVVFKLVSVAVLCVAAMAWILPGSQPDAVLGRYDYLEFWSAVVLTGAAISVWLVLLTPASRRRTTGFKACALWLGLLLGLGLAELLAFALPARHPMDNPWTLDGLRDSGELSHVRPAHVKWRGLTRGDLVAPGERDPDAHMMTFVTDMDGFRNDTDVQQADLVVIGDSFTEGGTVDDAQIFPTLLAGKLGVKGRNLGRVGYGPMQELIVLRKYGLACKPRTVVWQITEGNDLWDTAGYEKWVADGRPPYLAYLDRGWDVHVKAWHERSPTYFIYDRLRRYEREDWPFSGVFHDGAGVAHDVRFFLDPSLLEPALGHPGWEGFSRAIMDGAALCR